MILSLSSDQIVQKRVPLMHQKHSSVELNRLPMASTLLLE